MIDEILGYEDDKPIIQPKNYIYTAALIVCCKCNTIISGCGGPKFNALCVPCYEESKNDSKS